MAFKVFLLGYMATRICNDPKYFEYFQSVSPKDYSCEMLKLAQWFIKFICLLCFRFDTLTDLGAFMRTEFLCISVLRVASGPRVVG